MSKKPKTKKVVKYLVKIKYRNSSPEFFAFYEAKDAEKYIVEEIALTEGFNREIKVYDLRKIKAKRDGIRNNRTYTDRSRSSRKNKR